MGTTPRRGKPYVWVSWITKLLAGEANCKYAPWFKAHFKYDKRPDPNFNTAAWTADHTALVDRRRAELEADGFEVRVEHQNAIHLEGQGAVLAAKPDLIAVGPAEVRVSDGKTGKQRHSDFWQVLIYMLGLEMTRPEACADVQLRGEVVYREAVVPIEREELTAERRAQIFALVREVSADGRPPRVPSRLECSFCDLPDCPDRFVDDRRGAAVAREF